MSLVFDSRHSLDDLGFWEGVVGHGAPKKFFLCIVNLFRFASSLDLKLQKCRVQCCLTASLFPLLCRILRDSLSHSQALDVFSATSQAGGGRGRCLHANACQRRVQNLCADVRCVPRTSQSSRDDKPLPGTPGCAASQAMLDLPDWWWWWW